MKTLRLTCVVALGLLNTITANAAGIPAFPGAEGAGAMTPGGRGGVVLIVTQLDDDGPGSLRAAIDASGARTVVFRVGGTIPLRSPLTIRNPILTIAGQSAPRDGLCLRDHPLIVTTTLKACRMRGRSPMARDARDANGDFDRDGYSNLEDYLNDLCAP